NDMISQSLRVVFVGAVGLAAALSLVSCGDDPVVGPHVVCEAACAELASCGLVSADEAARCGALCVGDPEVARRDSSCTADDACDCLVHGSVRFDGGFALGAFPAVRGSGGELERQCAGGPVDGLLVDAVLVGRGTRPPDVAGI